MFELYLGIALTVIPLQLINHWAISEQRMHVVYPLSIVVYTLYFVAETMLALSKPEQLPVMLFNLVNAWGFFMACRGWRRLKKTGS
jgi:hypothetical protein